MRNFTTYTCMADAMLGRMRETHPPLLVVTGLSAPPHAKACTPTTCFIASGHCPLLLDCAPRTPCTRCFHFERFWPRVDGYTQIVLDAWSSCEPDLDSFRRIFAQLKAAAHNFIVGALARLGTSPCSFALPASLSPVLMLLRTTDLSHVEVLVAWKAYRGLPWSCLP